MIKTRLVDHDPPLGDGVFGLQTPDDPLVRLLPVPFEATTSYGTGTADGPAAVFNASPQLDLRDGVFGDVWSVGIGWEHGPGVPGVTDRGDRASVDRAAERVCSMTRDWVSACLAADRVPGVVGGEHSVSLGGLIAASEAVGSEPGEDGLGVLQIDAHHDLRHAYEGYAHSHASVMRHALDRAPGLTSLVAVGVRDFCCEEAEFAAAQGDRVTTFYDADLAERAAHGEAWWTVCEEIVSALPGSVWITFDIDGLDPSLCPGTGTPVPGGLTFREASVLLRVLAESGKRVVGFDLVEVAPAVGDREWNGNVGARVLYQLCGCAAATRS